MTQASEKRKFWYMDTRIDIRRQTPLMDFDDLSITLFPKAPKKAKAFKYIMDQIVKKRKISLMNDLVKEQNTDFSRVPLTIVWKQMQGGGMLKKGKRNELAEVNTLFSKKLLEVALVWIKLLGSKGFIDLNTEYENLKKIIDNSKINT